MLGLTDAQVRMIEKKRKYDEERYRRISNRAKWGSPEHAAKVTSRALKKRKAAGHAARTRLMGCYRWNAVVRGISFDLSREQFAVLVAANCHYCGSPPSSMRLGKDLWSPLVYTGIDRVDNALGYTKENTVPCCKICNRAKNTISLQDFNTWIARLVAHHTEIRL